MKPIKPPVFVKELSAGRQVVREIRDVETAGRVHRSWPGRGKAWRAAADALADFQYGDATMEEVRAAFAEAAREAGVLAEREG
jgi:phage terminase large subunit-like protein